MAPMSESIDRLSPRARLNEYYELCKPRVVMLIVFTAVVGMFLAVPGLPPLAALFWGTVGIATFGGVFIATRQRKRADTAKIARGDAQ